MYKYNKKYLIIITYLHLITMLLIIMETKKNFFNALVVVIIFLHITLHRKYCLNQFKVKGKLLLTKIYKEEILMVEILRLKV